MTQLALSQSSHITGASTPFLEKLMHNADVIPSTPTKDSLEGFMQGIERAGVTPRLEWIINGNYHPEEAYPVVGVHGPLPDLPSEITARLLNRATRSLRAQ